MRYWIWWNDLIQGPFELDELVSLRAFSEDLPVCLEDREDWLPASRVADLSSAVEQLRARRTPPMSPPPPPPKRSPTVTPLQGEFFGESPGQQPLLESEDEPKGPFAYRAITEDSGPPASYFIGEATMPFHFSQQPQSAIAVIEMLRPQAPQAPQVPRVPQVPQITFAPPPVIKESPVPKNEFPQEEEKMEAKPFISLELLQEKPSPETSFDLPVFEEKKLEWLPWILGVVLSIVALGSMGYWLMDRANTRSAIAEANRLEPPKPISIPSVSAGRAPESPALDQSTGGSPVAGSLESGQAKETGHGNSVVSSMRNSVSRLLVQWAKAISPLMSGPSSAVSQGSPAINSALSADRAPDNAAPSQSTGRLPDDASSESAASKEAATQKSIMSSARRELSSLLFQLAKAISPLTSGTSSAVGQESSAINQALSAGPAGSVAAVSGSLSSASKIGGDGSHSAVPGAPETPTLNQPAGGLAGPSSGESASSKETPTDKSVVSSMRNEMSSLLSQLVKAVSPFLGRSSLGAGQGASGIPPALSAGPAGSVAAVPSSLSSASKASGYASVPTRGAKSSKSKMKKAAMKKKLIHRNGAAARGKTLAGTSDVPLSNPSGGILPGVGTSASDTASVPGAAANGVPSIEAGRPNDPWKGRQNEAIALVIAKTLPRSKITIGNQARAMLQEMHEKELMHAANTGERLYLPDKLAWTALQEEGFHYRVYLNFLSWQANGERVQSRSYQFLADLKTKEIRADDPATQQDLLTQPAELTFKHNPMATDIDSILGGVDTYNKHKVQLIIVKKNGRNRDERKKMEAALNIAAEKVRRAVIYFRRTYSEKALQNVAKAYDFLELLKG